MLTLSVCFLLLPVFLAEVVRISFTEVELGAGSRRQLERAASRVAPSHAINSVIAGRFETNRRVFAGIEFAPFETTSRSVRFKTSDCEKRWRGWRCDSPVDILRVRTPHVELEIGIDEAIPSRVAVQLVDFLRSRPIAPYGGEKQPLSAEQVETIREIRINDDDNLEVWTGESTSRGYVITVVSDCDRSGSCSFQVRQVNCWIA